MRKLVAFNVRPDEVSFFHKYAEEKQIQIDLHSVALTPENMNLIDGYDGVSLLTSPVTREVLTGIKAAGIKYVATRSVGYDNIDLEAAKELGIHVSNAEYSPGSVAEFALMLILMSLRKTRAILRNSDLQDYTITGLHGRELKDTTVGVIGAGKIGATLIKYLSGFGCEILAYDPYENEEVKKYATYVSFDELVQRADVISLHLLLREETQHILNKKAFAKMKDGVILVNCARGELVDSEALIEALESGKVRAAALDVVEGDQPFFNKDKRLAPLPNRNMALLASFPNVTITPHIAFYTLGAVSEMVTCALDSLDEFYKTGKARKQII
ncbi:D-lactate dehydrogenase VanH-B [Actinomycetaceae bacterium TAE3-ERU4]|nr:D-lactate dehydrogenase VanH-B [Actinomycetaceae bacterium TAE3-ERU4]